MLSIMPTVQPSSGVGGASPLPPASPPAGAASGSRASGRIVSAYIKLTPQFSGIRELNVAPLKLKDGCDHCAYCFPNRLRVVAIVGCWRDAINQLRCYWKRLFKFRASDLYVAPVIEFDSDILHGQDSSLVDPGIGTPGDDLTVEDGVDMGDSSLVEPVFDAAVGGGGVAAPTCLSEMLAKIAVLEARVAWMAGEAERYRRASDYWSHLAAQSAAEDGDL